MPLRSAALVAAATAAAALDNGLGLTPPMGWRSWNAYHTAVTQQMMEAVMDKMTERTRKVDGVPTSYADLGYVNCGLDDYWQECYSGVNGSFHAANGRPLINSKFPDMGGMTAKAHKLGLRCGWYMNNCGCAEHQFSGDNVRVHMEGSVKALAEYGFDGLKLDGCGQFLNLTWWAELVNATGRPILIENCHWGGTTPGHTGLGAANGPSQADGPCAGTAMPSECPYNFYRTSGDITNTWKSMFSNLQSVRPFQGEPPLSRPGAWAYPDMMEVGRLASAVEDRSHFGAWCIVSSPLVLGHDLTDEALNDRVWEVVSNKEAIAVNQAWAGHPGRLVKEWDPKPAPTDDKYLWAVSCDGSDKTQSGWSYDASKKRIVAGDGSCAEAADSGLIVFHDCDSGKKEQSFTMNSDHTVTAYNGNCLDTYDYRGPVVQLWGCNGGSNQQFSLTSGKVKIGSGQCLSERLGAPSEEGGKRMQMWSKPVPSGAEGRIGLAVLLLNNDVEGHAVTIDLAADLGITTTAQVRDIWAKADLPAAAGNFTTDTIGSHDSRFLKFTY